MSTELSCLLWPEIADTRPLTFSSQTRLAKVIAQWNARPESGCLLATWRQKVVGIATRQDLMIALAQNPDWASLRLSDIVTRPVITIEHSEINQISPLIPFLIECLEQHQIGYLPIVDQDAHLLGVIDRSHLLRVLQTQQAALPLLTEQHHQRPLSSLLPAPLQRAQIFADITLKIRQSLQLKEILQTTVDEIQQLLKADRVLIYQVMPDGTGKAISETVVAPYPSILEMTFPEEVFPLDYQALYAKGRVRAIADVHDPSANVSDCLVEFINQWGIKSKLIVPIVRPLDPTVEMVEKSEPVRRNLWGLLIAHQCSHVRHWSDFELDLMQQLAGQISLALSQGQLMTYLEERVRLRTAELTETNRALKQEIRERKQVGKALRQSEAQLRLITNNLPVLIAYVDRQQRYQFNNHVYQEWLGFSPADITGQSMRQIMGAAYYQKIQPHIEAVLMGKQVSYESELTFQDGRDRSVSVNYIPHLESTGDKKGENRIRGFFALTTDISDRKAIERMKDEFIAVVSHELRTPLTSIHTSIKLLATGQLGNLLEEGQEMLTVADENTDRLVRLVTSVLDLQRIESGKVTMDAKVCSTAELIRQAAETMQTIAHQHRIEIQAQSDNLFIWADPDYMIQTLTNLLGNAIKFSEPETIVRLSVTVSDSPSKPSPAQALFCVQDQGQGIPSEQLNSIFERFQQVDSSDARKKGGTGLGLTICRKIVEQHGGDIWAESHLGQGSHFYFTIPLASDVLSTSTHPI